jgi:C1A family cysteine protease
LKALETTVKDGTELSADHMTLQNHFGLGQDAGGDYSMASAYLLAWQGPVAEADDPYGDRYVEMSDYAEYFKEQYGIVFSDEQMQEMRTVEKENKAIDIKRVQVDVIEKHLKNSYPEALAHLKKAVGF